MQLKHSPSKTPPEDYVYFQEAAHLRHKNGEEEIDAEDGLIHGQLMIMQLEARKYIPNSVATLGCRTGYELELFQSTYPTADIIGVDIVKSFVEKAGERGEAILADMHSLPFVDGRYEVVFASQSLEHCYDVGRALSEMLRVAARYVYISVPLESIEKYTQNPSHHAYTCNPIPWIKLFECHPLWRVENMNIHRKNTVDILARYLGQEYDEA